MALSQVDKIAAIQDEVNELHPILNRLLRKLPNIMQVEYTHGTGEMGADFVLVKKHESLGIPQYVGIIAKVGKVSQDYSAIERQIKECNVPRTLFGGRKKEHMDEIWVIVTQTISDNAKEKIYEEYKTRNIVFINGKLLADLIEKYMPDYWTEIDVEVGEYLTILRTRNQEIDKKFGLLHGYGEEIYINQDIIKTRPRSYGSQTHHLKDIMRIDISEELKKHDFILIEGGMGAGKSKFLRRLVNIYSTPETYLETKIMPVLVSFKEFIEEYEGVVELLIKSKIGNKINPDNLKDTVYLLLIDAVDEKNLPIEEQIQFLQDIRHLAITNRQFKVIVTSRYMRFISSDNRLWQDMARYEMSPLSLARIIEFLSSICHQLNTRTRLLEDLKKSQLFKQLPKSPIAAILLAQLINENSQDLPSNLTELYSKYIELMLGRWDIEKGLQSQKEYEALDNILMQLATYIIDNELTSVAISEVRQIFKDYLAERNLRIDPNDLFDKMKNRTEIIIVDEDNLTISFKHRTFAEYLYAKHLLRKGSLVIDSRAFQFYWANIYFFCLGIKKDAPELLESLINLPAISEGERWIKLINMSNYLLAAYTTPYAHITEGVKRIVIEAAELYADIAERRMDSFFAIFSRMQLLFILQYFMRNNYAFEFLKKAIEDAAFYVEESDYSNDIKVYSLFILNVIYIDIGDGATFDFILSKYLKDLPTDLSLAIRHETENATARTKLMRKHDRHVKRLLRDNDALEAAKERWYNRPLKTLPLRREATDDD